MVDPQVLPAFLVAVLVVTVAPGPDNTYIAAVALRHGARAGVVSALGMACGMVVHVVATALGLAALLRIDPMILVVVRLVGAGYLGWLAYEAVRDLRAQTGGVAVPQTRAVLRRALVTNLTNPKVVVFFAAFLPGFVRDGHGPVAAQMLTLGVLFLAVGLICDTAVGLGAGLLGRTLGSRGRTGRLFTALAACVYAGLAAILVTDAVRTIAG